MEEFIGLLTSMGVTSSVSIFSEPERVEDFFGGLDSFVLGGVFGDFVASGAVIMSFGVSRVLEDILFNRVTEASFSITFFSFTVILC